MPLAYPSGMLAEHRACRDAAVVFDVSHLGSLRVTGPNAFDLLQSRLSNDLARIAPGRAQYSLLLDEDATVVDDLIVWWLSDETFELLPNAANTAAVQEAFGHAAVDRTAERALLAVQGPTARHHLSRIWPEAAEVGRFEVSDLSGSRFDGQVAGTGYTGEDGVEISVPADRARELWDALLDEGVVPAGLGARDTLRLEMGLPLHGNEFQPGQTPLQAGLGWVIGWDKGDFTGREALLAERERGVPRRIRALLCEGRRPPRSGQEVRMGDRSVGTVSSGNLSPVLDRGIALAYLEPDIGIGDAVVIDVRGRDLAAEVVKPPFITPSPPRST